MVLNARSRRHRVDNFAGPLSIKTVLTGEVGWVVGGRELRVNQSSFLVLSEGERYSMNIDEVKSVETCCVFFRPGYVERVAQDLTSPMERSLEDFAAQAPVLPYLSALHLDRPLVERVQRLALRCKGLLTPSSFEEEFLTLALELLGFYERVRAESARLPAVREATRQELFRRLLIGREYMHSQTAGPLSLEMIAREACLSPFHFHRGFKQAFEQTPHQYLTALRLERARSMIAVGTPVLEACVEVGFSSPSAFSRLFKSHFGEIPSAVRRKFARSGKTGDES